MLRWRNRALASIVALVATVGCGGAGSLGPLPAGGIHVLFVGNSLTYVNDLPGTVAALGASVGDTIRVSSATGADLALIDHLNGATNALAQLKAGGWNYVVLQQGSSTLPVNRDSLTLWTKMFDPYIKAAGAKTALYMVWPTSDRAAFFDDCRLAYQQAAQSVNGVFMPAGEAWLKAWAFDPSLQLYSSDGLHPTPLGTYLAALVIYERITGHDARALPSNAMVAGKSLLLQSTVVRQLQAAAHAANQQYSSR
jgi:hypothetical protein